MNQQLDPKFDRFLREAEQIPEENVSFDTSPDEKKRIQR